MCDRIGFIQRKATVGFRVKQHTSAEEQPAYSSQFVSFLMWGPTLSKQEL